MQKEDRAAGLIGADQLIERCRKIQLDSLELLEGSQEAPVRLELRSVDRI